MNNFQSGKSVLFICVATFTFIFSATMIFAEERSTGWQCPAGSCSRNTSDPTGDWHGYFGTGPAYGYHVGIDYMRSVNYPIQAIANGEIVDYSSSLSGYGDACGGQGGAMLVKHIAEGHDGYLRTFYAVYGHMYKDSNLSIGDIVEKGEEIGNLHYYYGPPGVCNNESWTHLHFGIRPDQIDPVAHFRGVASIISSDNGWTHPMNFLDDNFPADYEVSCSKLEEKYPNVFQSLGIAGCQTAFYVYPNQYIVWYHGYNMTWGYDGSIVKSFTVDSNANITALNVDVPEGVGFGGGGYATFPNDYPESGSLPDFITDELELKNSSGIEKYVFTRYETVQFHSYSKNIGDANWAAFPGESEADDIYVKFYLSNGYKEDSHSVWDCVGTQQINKGNLDVGETKHEWDQLNLATYNNGNPIPPGVYNIVACVDRKYDNDNGDGEVPEIHKSNNCSTEAVFTVSPDINLFVQSLKFSGELEFFKEGDVPFAQVSVGNSGAEPSVDVSVNWYIDEVFYANDSIEHQNITQGAVASEDVTLPNNLTLGEHSVQVCIDFNDGSPADNCMVFPFYVYIPGDLNHDHTVNINDFTLLAGDYGLTQCGIVADINGDCIVNTLDFTILQTNYGRSE